MAQSSKPGRGRDRQDKALRLAQALKENLRRRKAQARARAAPSSEAAEPDPPADHESLTSKA